MRVRRRRNISRTKVEKVKPFYIKWDDCADLINSTMQTVIYTPHSGKYTTVSARWYKIMSRRLGFDLTIRRDEYGILDTARIWFESESAYTMFKLKWANR